MITGVGIDLVHIPRLARIAQKWENRFLDRIFTEQEKAYCFKRSDPYPCLAARFAVKEAFFKASSLKALPWREIEIVNSPEGRPSVLLHGPTRTVHRRSRIHISIAHDGDHAVAQVVIENPEGESDW